ncbi:MAG: DUF2520 domain-containing protein [Bryobacteraceae bacterium]|nr:DUF2520 domain-containing protein [Bryobacteraceae bacterium]
MKKTPSVGLVGAGSVSRSCLARIPKLREQLGPVKAPSFRVASRLANTLRSGFAVREYSDLARSKIILLAVPERILDRTVDELAASSLEWAGRTVILCCRARDSRTLQRLARLGARVASLDSLGDLREERFVVEGDRDAVRDLARLLGEARTRLIEIDASHKDLYRAGIWMSSQGLLPLLDAAVVHLRRAGMARQQALPIVAELMHRSLRDYQRAGRKARNAPQLWPADEVALEPITPRPQPFSAVTDARAC